VTGVFFAGFERNHPVAVRLAGGGRKYAIAGKPDCYGQAPDLHPGSF